MKLQLNQVIPQPIAGYRKSDIWGKNIRLENKEQFFLRAPSGKGKSTFIHILYGLRSDYTGEVRWDGHLASQQTQDQWAEWRSKELSIVFQDLRLFEDLNIYENIQVKQALTEYISMEQAIEWVNILGLAGKLQQKAGTLSYGEKQRVAIIRALMQPFTWLLLDEPFSHLDNDNIKIAASLITEQVEKQEAGLMMVDLEDNTYFPFYKKLNL